MNTAISIFAALVLLSLLVMIHEMGHYLAGRALGFSILEFSIGMGPKLLKKKDKHGTEFNLRAFPIGGMCRFEGEDEEAANERSFNAQKVWKRIIVVLAGPITNLVFAILLAFVTLTAFGDFVPAIYSVDTDTPAAVAGVLPGDVILKIDDKPVRFYFQTVDMVLAVKTNDTTMTVKRDGVEQTLQLKNIYNDALGKNKIGVTITTTRESFSVGQSALRSVNYVSATLVETVRFIGRALQGNASSSDAAGPVAIVAIISEAVRSSGETVLRQLVLISASLGIMNLLPIPAMDGGRFVFMLLEVVRGKPIPQEKEGMIHFIGLLLLFGLIIFMTFNDVSNLMNGTFN
ncbi:MAG: M50 family metallopeptidase [Eubacteriales bacterium]|nr:M50 family metallopeptidase [Eubacteriales bacterium]